MASVNNLCTAREQAFVKFSEFTIIYYHAWPIHGSCNHVTLTSGFQTRAFVLTKLSVFYSFSSKFKLARKNLLSFFFWFGCVGTFFFFLNKKKVSDIEEIIESSDGSRHLFIIPLKNFHLFKIVESVINFNLKKNSN